MEKLGLNNRKIVFWILTIVLMAVIFYFSSKDADESTNESHRIGKTIGYILEYDFENWTEDAQERYAERIDHPIRKTAHFLEYMTLGILLFGAWFTPDESKYVEKRSEKDSDENEDENTDKRFSKSIVKNQLIPFGISVLYSITDEIHQQFVSGRTGMAIDVLLDSAGALSGILLASLASHLYLKFINS